VLVVPLRIGGGSRLKILEALAMGTPVVSTRIGAEGLQLRPGSHFVEVDGAEDLAPALIRALCDPERSRAQAEGGRRVVLDRYDWDGLADALEQVWYACVDRCHPASRVRALGESWASAP
jgi:glycosyltransferase involved in cell wall biosynthesis